MRIRRQFTVEGRSAYEGIAFRCATSEIRNPDGSVVFSQSKIEGPAEYVSVLALRKFNDTLLEI